MNAIYHMPIVAKTLADGRFSNLEPVLPLSKNTPHHCALEEGIISEALLTIGAEAMIVQQKCLRMAADSCVRIAFCHSRCPLDGLSKSGFRWLKQ